jgi:hypothetical protein
VARTEDASHDDAGYEPPKKKTNAVLWVVVGVVTGVLFVCVGGPVALTLMWADMARRDDLARQEIAARAEVEHEQAKRAEVVAKKARVYDRTEFREVVMGKTEQEVLDAVGEPDRKEDKGADDLTSFYTAKTLNPVTRKPDATTAVRFKSGRAEAVSP